MDETSAEYTPDGSRIVFSGNCAPGGMSQVCVMNADGTGVVALTTGCVGHCLHTAVNSTGSRIVFDLWDFPYGLDNIWTVNIDGSGLRKITDDADFANNYPDW